MSKVDFDKFLVAYYQSYHTDINILAAIDEALGEQGLNINDLKADAQQDDKTPFVPRFAVGDWISDGVRTMRIKEVDVNNNRYYLENGLDNGFVVFSYADKCFHPWSINDAHNGDVLFTPSGAVPMKNGTVFIFKGTGNHPVSGNGCVLYHCGTSGDGNAFLLSYNRDYMCHTCDTISPATKQQEKLLYGEMVERGYMWDPINKQVTTLNKKADDSTREDSLYQKGYDQAIEDAAEYLKGSAFFKYQHMMEGLLFIDSFKEYFKKRK